MSKKAPRKKLQTCPHCGARGLMNLKAHRCKVRAGLAGGGGSKALSLELLKPANKKVLEDCAKNIKRVYQTILGRTRTYHDVVVYDLVEAGVYFLRAKEQLAHGEFEDFLKSATVADLDISERSARNYMNAARNAGLSADSTASDVEKLRDKKALHGRKPTDLYQLTDGDGGGASVEQDNDAAPSKSSVVKDTLINLRSHCESIVKLRDNLSKKAFQTACARLLGTLEDLSGSTWDTVKERKGKPFTEHGDVYELGN